MANGYSPGIMVVALDYIFGFHSPSYSVRGLYAEYLVGVLIVTAISSFIIGVKMRRRIKKDLGRKATDIDLASVETWIEVDQAEEKAAKTEGQAGPIK